MRLVSGILLVCFISILICCRTTSNCSINFKKEAADSSNWYYNFFENHYFANVDFLNRIYNNYNTCLVGKDSTFISSIFGLNYQFTDSTMIYPLSKHCSGSGINYHCINMYFILDSKGLVKRFYYSFSKVSISH